MFRRKFVLFRGMIIPLCWLGMAQVGNAVSAQGPSPVNIGGAQAVIKSESNVVLVDVIVTDKKGHYLKDINRKEFHVFEDGKEQPVTTFSREADASAGTSAGPRYLVLLFDNTGLDPDGQMWERTAAYKFLETTPSPKRLTAVVDYGGGLHVAQNFTANIDLLKNAIRNVKFASNQANVAGTAAAPVLLGRGPIPPQVNTSSPDTEQSALASRNLMEALRDVARMLGPAPGRKTIILFSPGLNLPSTRQSDFQGTTDALNKANVGVYPIASMGLTSSSAQLAQNGGSKESLGSYSLGLQLGPSTAVLDALAEKTGGFPLVNSNDLLEGMEKVSEEASEYYLIGYVPPNPVHDGRYHQIRVKVDRTGVEVRARSGYADTRSADLLAGKTEGAALEAKATDFEAGQIPVSLTTPYFYVRPGVARVNLALSIPGSAVDFEKHGDSFHSRLDVPGNCLPRRWVGCRSLQRFGKPGLHEG